MSIFDRILGRAAPAPTTVVLSPPPPAQAPRFRSALEVVLAHEGGLVNHPDDPGGITNLGISLRAARGMGSMADVDGDGDVDADDIIHMTVEHAAEIYYSQYWTSVRADQLPLGVDLMVFDFAVNAGPRRAAMMLQRAVGTKADGIIGPKTMEAAQGLLDVSGAIGRMARYREDFYRNLPTFPKFGRGWLRRTEEVKLASLQRYVAR